MVDARDAILLADEQNYGGVHVCTLVCDSFGFLMLLLPLLRLVLLQSFTCFCCLLIMHVCTVVWLCTAWYGSLGVLGPI